MDVAGKKQVGVSLGIVYAPSGAHYAQRGDGEASL